MHAPRFSVVCPAFRAVDTIAATIESVLGQSCADLEMLVVDDGSGDATPEIADAYAARDARIRVIRQPNGGTAAARNTGIAAATGHHVSLIDNDDVWLPSYLEEVGAAFDSAPGAGLAFADAWTFNDRSCRVHRLTTLSDLPPVPPVLGPDDLLLALLRVNFVTASGATVTREALAAAGPFEAEISGSDDWDMWLRIAASGHGGVRVGESPLVILRDSRNQQSKNRLQMLEAGERTAIRARERAAPGSPARDAAQAYVDGLQAELKHLRRRSAIAWLRPKAVAVRNRLIRRRNWRPAPVEVCAAMSAVEPTIGRTAG